MITAAELCSPVAAILRTIEAQAFDAQAKGQQFICLTTVANYIPNRAACDVELIAKGYAVNHGCLGWGSYVQILELPIIEQRIAEAKTKYTGIGIDTDEITCTVEELRAWAKARGYTLEHSPSVDAYILKW